MTPQLRQWTYASFAQPHALVEEGIHDACLTDCDSDRRGYPLQKRPYWPYVLQDLMWMPKKTVEYLQEVI
eukprot:1445181-Lingulodinium_polyedra.AAC.1